MTYEQKLKLKSSIKKDIVAFGFVLLLLIGNWISTAVAAIITIFLVFLWITMILKWDHIKEESYKDRHSYSNELILLGFVDYAATITVFIMSPLDSLWMGVLAGLYTINSFAGAFLMIAHKNRL